MERLRRGPLKHGELKALAKDNGFSVRTIYAWSRGGGGGRPGRPKRPVEERVKARAEIAPVLNELARGKRGWRSTKRKLEDKGVHVATRLIQELLPELEGEAAKRLKDRIEAERVHVEVLARDAVWALDQMDFGRVEHESVRALQADDCCTQRILDVTVGPPAKGCDVVALLERAAAERGGKYPFVVQMDNGSENNNALVRAWAAEHGVILLFNVPHTPQHNPHGERTNGDLRVASGLDKPTLRSAGGVRGLLRLAGRGVRQALALVATLLAKAWHSLDVRTPRASLGNRTPCELDRTAPRAEDRACRARFYREVCEELERIARLPCNARARRKLEREAIWCALERHGLVKRTRGGLPVRAFKSEVIT